jgi:uncharacterized membrane protein
MQQYQKEDVWRGEYIQTSEHTRAFDGLQQPAQNTDYQQGYTQQGQQPPYMPGMQSQQGYYAHSPQFVPLYSPHESSIDGRTIAILSYVGLWLSALLVILFVPKNRFIRFHAMQSLLFYGGVNVLYIVLISIMAHHVPFLFGFAIFFFVIMNIVASVAWFVGLIGAISGKYTKLPFVGNFAERFANQGQATVK